MVCSTLDFSKMDRPYRTKSRNLFRLWTGHDLADHGPALGGYRPAFITDPTR
jgi:hypothetical protein